MTFIQISDLTTVANESFVVADSFLNKLEKNETIQIFGGWRGGGWSDKRWKKDDCNWSKDDCNWKKEEKWSSKEGYDYSYYYKKKRNGGWKKDC